MRIVYAFATSFLVCQLYANDFDWTEAVKEKFVLYENKESFVQKLRFTMRTQYQVAVVQPNGSNGNHLKPGASPVNQEFRRFWVGLNTEMKHGLKGVLWTRVGGMPIRESYSNGETHKNYSYSGLFMLTLRKDWASLPGFYTMAGKMMPHFSTDYTESSATMKVIERSLICQQYNFDSNWGLELAYRPQKNNYVMAQLLANDRAANGKSASHPDAYRDGRGFKGEFGWEDKCFGILSAGYQLREGETYYDRLTMQFAHDFNNAYHGRRKPGANNYGMGVKDAVSVGYQSRYGKWTFVNNVIGNFEMQTAPGDKNIGWQIQPIYDLMPRVDMVFRYTGMTGKGACSLGSERYVCRQTTTPSWVDSVHSFYLGASFYYSVKNPDAAKLMVGTEYFTSRKNGVSAFNGWEYSVAVRFNF